MSTCFVLPCPGGTGGGCPCLYDYSHWNTDDASGVNPHTGIVPNVPVTIPVPVHIPPVPVGE